MGGSSTERELMLANLGEAWELQPDKSLCEFVSELCGLKAEAEAIGFSLVDDGFLSDELERILDNEKQV